MKEKKGVNPSYRVAKSSQGDIEYDSSSYEWGHRTLSEDDLKVLKGNRFVKFLFAPVRKAIVSGVMSLVVSIAWALSPNSFTLIAAEDGETLDYVIAAVAIVLTGLYIVFLVGLAVHERRYEQASADYREAYNRLVQSNNALVMVLSGQKAILMQVSQKANEAIHAIERGERVDPTFWAFEDSCQSACDSVRRVLLDYCGGADEDDIEVGYVRLDEDATTPTITLCAFSGGAGSIPRILWKSRRIDEDSYFDSRLFREGYDGVTVLQGNKEIRDSFYWPVDTGVQSKAKYSQFSTMPVFCNRGHGGAPKMIGLFEVSCLGGSLGESGKEVENVMKSIVSPYGNTMLVIHKLHKGVHVLPPSAKPLSISRKRGRR